MLLTPPRGEYAVEALELALEFEGFLLLPEQRVGKTWISLAIADHRKPSKLLIVTRKGAIREWHKQLAEHIRIDWDCDLRIETHESFSRSKGKKAIRQWFKKTPRDECMIILDECHKIKKRGSKMGMGLRQIAKRYAKYRVGLSGTPIGEGLENGWALMDFVDPSVFGSYESFERRFLIMGGFRGLKVEGYRNKKTFRKLLASRSYRKTLREARDTPLKVRVSPRYCVMDKASYATYMDLEDGLDVIVQRKKVRLKLMMNAAGKCHQVAGGFLIRDRDDDGLKLPTPDVLPMHRAKLELLGKIIRQHPGERFVISAKYKHELRAIRRVCRSLGLSTKTVRGGKPYDGNFNRDVVIIQSQAGIAIDLSEASIAIFYSLDYSFIVNAQMRSRILSYTKKFARYYYLITRGTVDEDAYEAWRTKRKLSDVILDRWRRR